MCGIAGLIDLDGSPPKGWLDVMLAAMRDRGPDGEGRHVEPGIALGMRRLAVIDIAGGTQPLAARHGRVLAFQNGEIYNHQALRRELAASGAVFATASDTEVLAHGYAQWGIDGLLARLDGMFALAILDRDTRTLHLARDRFGEKPLFVAAAARRLAYASSLSVVGALPWVDDSVDPLALERYYALHFCPGARTILRGVTRLLPGERMSIGLDDLASERQRWYVPALGAPRNRSDDELAALLEHAVTSRLVADVPVGVFLSGGLDSAVLCAIAARHSPGLATFSMGFDSAPHDESAAAARVAMLCGATHHAFQFDGNAFATMLPRVARALDEPVGDQACLPLLMLCVEARRHATVVLSGEGADELFAGYGYYRGHTPGSLRSRLRAWLSPVDHAAELLGDAPPATPSGFPLLTTARDRERLLGVHCAPDLWQRDAEAWWQSARGPLQRASAADIATWLPDDLLVKFDRMAMAVSLEGRAPYLQPALAEAALALPSRQRMHGDGAKVALRRVASRWLPADIVARRKQGFVLPMRTWLAQWFAAQGGAAGWVEHAQLPHTDPGVLTELVAADLAAGLERERLLYALALLGEWHAAATADRAALTARYRAAA